MADPGPAGDRRPFLAGRPRTGTGRSGTADPGAADPVGGRRGEGGLGGSGRFRLHPGAQRPPRPDGPHGRPAGGDGTAGPGAREQDLAHSEAGHRAHPGDPGDPGRRHGAELAGGHRPRLDVGADTPAHGKRAERTRQIPGLPRRVHAVPASRGKRHGPHGGTRRRGTGQAHRELPHRRGARPNCVPIPASTCRWPCRSC